MSTAKYYTASFHHVDLKWHLTFTEFSSVKPMVRTLSVVGFVDERATSSVLTRDVSAAWVDFYREQNIGEILGKKYYRSIQ